MCPLNRGPFKAVESDGSKGSKISNIFRYMGFGEFFAPSRTTTSDMLGASAIRGTMTERPKQQDELDQTEVDIPRIEAIEAYKSLEAKLAAIKKEDLRKIRYSAIESTSRGLWLAENAEKDRDKFFRKYREPPRRAIDAIRQYALAVTGAAIMNEPEDRPDPPDFEEAKEMRAKLIAVARVVFWRNRKKQQTILNIERGSGHEDLADDLLKLCKLILQSWKTVAKKNLLTMDEANRAGALATEIMAWIGRREEKSRINLNREEEQRAWTLMAEAYDELRDHAYMIYRKRPGIWDKRYPNLYSPVAPSRGRIRRRGDEKRPIDENPTPPEGGGE